MTKGSVTPRTAARSTPLAIARHIVSEAHRERVRLRRLRPRRTSAAPQEPASPVRSDSPLRVLVGVDHSDSSRRALRWAAREAAQHHGRLTVCWIGTVPLSAPDGQADASSARGFGDSIDDELAAAVAETAPDLDPARQQILVLGPRLQELLELARSCDLLVMARPQERYFAVLPSAAVTRRLLSQAGCPVLLVP